MRRHIHAILEGGRSSGTVGVVFELLLIALIAANAAAATIESIPQIGEHYQVYFDIFEAVSVAAFTLEYALRLWTAPEDPTYIDGPFGRLRYMLRPFMLIDFIAIFPAYVGLFVPSVDLRVLRLFRLFRLLKIARYSPAVSTLMHVLSSERRALFGTLLLTLCVMSLSAECMYILEGNVQPHVFGTLPDCMYWAIITLTTVGYGDKVPVTEIGKLLAGITAVLGLGLFALPVGIVASGFMGEIHRRDFVLTTALLSRIPLFANLDTEISRELMIALRSHMVTQHKPIVIAGEPATAMYFIVAGHAKAEGGPRRALLGPGNFFGADAVLHARSFEATVFATTDMKLLSLPRQDLVMLVRKFPNFRRNLERASGRMQRKMMARSRLADTAEEAEPIEP